MENIFETAKSIQEKRAILKGLSQPFSYLLKRVLFPL